MTEPKLKSSLWVKAQIKICDKISLPIFVVRKGDPDAGSILLKINRLASGIEIYNQARTHDGALAWISAKKNTVFNEENATKYIDNQCQLDPDIWILEVEDPKHKFEINHLII